jgi:dCMP deaminase
MALTDRCVCGHVRDDHIYYVGACRPGFVCPAECTEFIVSRSLLESTDWEVCLPDPVNARPDWDEYFFGIARAVAARADCRRAQHGAVVVRDRRIIATGYNGSVPGGPSCLAGECPRGLKSKEEVPSNHADYSDCHALHAEQNAVAHAAGDLQGATIYITGRPCDMCGKLCAAAGLTVRYPDDGGS